VSEAVATTVGLRAAPDDSLFDARFMERLARLEIVAKRVFRGDRRGERRSRRLGAGLEFADHRSYVPGDDFRHIDWNIYGRLGKLLLRLYEEEEDVTVTLLVDSSASMATGGRLTTALRLAAAMAYIALSHLDRAQVATFGEGLGPRLRPARGKAQIFRVLSFLRGIEAKGETRFSDAMGAFVHQAPRPGPVVLISDLYAQDGHEEGLERLLHHGFEPLVVHLVDPRDGRPDLVGDVELVDAETGATREVTITPALLDRYARGYEDWRAGIKDFCRARRIAHHEADCREPFDAIMMDLLRAGDFAR
jgi:uncharacterized protein (DUF58 family)